MKFLKYSTNGGNKLWLLITILTLSGCATTTLDPWTDLDTDLSPATTPLDCGSFPYPSEVIGDSVVYDKSGLNDLDAYRTCSEANEAIASEHVSQINQLKLARKGLTEAGQAQRRIADMKQEMLDDERRHNLWQTSGLYMVILALGFAL